MKYIEYTLVILRYIQTKQISFPCMPKPLTRPREWSIQNGQDELEVQNRSKNNGGGSAGVGEQSVTNVWD